MATKKNQRQNKPVGKKSKKQQKKLNSKKELSKTQTLFRPPW